MSTLPPKAVKLILYNEGLRAIRSPYPSNRSTIFRYNARPLSDRCTVCSRKFIGFGFVSTRPKPASRSRLRKPISRMCLDITDGATPTFTAYSPTVLPSSSATCKKVTTYCIGIVCRSSRKYSSAPSKFKPTIRSLLVKSRASMLDSIPFVPTTDFIEGSLVLAALLTQRFNDFSCQCMTFRREGVFVLSQLHRISSVSDEAKSLFHSAVTLPNIE